MENRSISLGSFAASLLGTHPWNDGYPAQAVYVQELESLLLFAQQEGRLSSYLPRVTARLPQRDEALNELRVAVYFKSHGYQIVEWEPQGSNGKLGEFSIARNLGDVIFVEVKSPGYESELDPIQLESGRKKQPKYIPEEKRGGALGTWQHVRRCLSNAYPKFAPDRMNLLVIVDDFFVPLDDRQMEIALYGPREAPIYYGLGCFGSAGFEYLGGAARFMIEHTYDPLAGRDHIGGYRFCFYVNPFAFKPLPDSFRRIAVERYDSGTKPRDFSAS